MELPLYFCGLGVFRSDTSQNRLDVVHEEHCHIATRRQLHLVKKSTGIAKFEQDVSERSVLGVHHDGFVSRPVDCVDRYAGLLADSPIQVRHRGIGELGRERLVEKRMLQGKPVEIVYRVHGERHVENHPLLACRLRGATGCPDCFALVPEAAHVFEKVIPGFVCQTLRLSESFEAFPESGLSLRKGVRDFVEHGPHGSRVVALVVELGDANGDGNGQRAG